MALTITLVSIVAVCVLGVVGLTRSDDKAQGLLATLLPLLGTWVGTVLAFYFSRENFESASRSVNNLVKQLTSSEKLSATLARDKMIPNDPKQLFSKREPSADIVLSTLLTELDNARKGSRVPVFDAQGQSIRYVVHRSMIEQYLTTRALNGDPTDALAKMTFADLLSSSATLKETVESFAIVGSDATLADVKARMDAKQTCQDAFVTTHGSPSDPVLGWITNVIVEENSRV